VAKEVIEIEDAEREGVPLLISIAGASGAGKTPSALKLARGLAADPGDDLRDPAVLERVDRLIGMIDGDARRSLFYAPAEGEPPGPMKFKFRRIDWKSPFTCEGLEARIDRFETAGMRVIIIDSFSYVWDGPGGCVEVHDDFCRKEVERSRDFAVSKGWKFDEDKAWDRASMEGWKVAKRPHSLMVNRILQCRAHLIFCMHADDKLRFGEETDERSGKKKVTITQPKDIPIRERWVPICEKKFPRHLSDRLLLVPERPGYPLVQRAHDDHKKWIDEDRMIDEALGVNLAAWARGAAKQGAGPLNISQSPAADDHPSPGQRTTSGGAAPAAPPPSPPLPPSDTFPGDLIELWGQTYDHARPRLIEAAIGVARMDADDVAKVAKTLAELIRRAKPENKHAWLAAQGEELAALRARGPKWVTALEELAGPKPDDAPPQQQQTGTDDF
jgi:hypothetical protein